MYEVVFDEAKLAGIQHLLRRFPGALRRIVPPAVNQTADAAREDFCDEITAIRTIRRRSVKSKIKITKATAGRWSAFVKISKRRISLMGFGAKWWYAPGTRVMRRSKRTEKLYASRARVVTYNISGQKYLQHAFIAVGKSSNRLVFERIGKARHPLRSLSGPSLGRVVEDAPAILERCCAAANEDLVVRIHREVARFLSSVSMIAAGRAAG